IAYPYMKLLHLDTLAISFISFYILAYGISIMENWGQLGLPLPSFIKDHLEKLKNLSDKGKLSIHIDVDKKEEK
ncbi:phage holin family protein, partial [Listeria monocytogenes]|nr:phage holin family protein [Listeria monocytogenes]